MKTQSALTRIVAILTLAALLVGPLASTTSAAEKGKPAEETAIPHIDTSLTLSHPFITEGDQVALTLTAVVTVSGDAAATGTVSFKVGGVRIADVAITTIGGSQTATATFDASGLRAGEHTFHAHYRGSFNDSNAIAKLTVAAKPAPPAPPSDTTAPVITQSGTGTLTANDWYTSDVSVSWSVTDPESAIVSQSGCGTVTIATDTTGISLTCTATSAGGTSSSTRTIKRDATAPTIGASASPAANLGGWNNTEVTITFTCGDATSGVASCAQPVTLSTDGSGQAVTGDAIDNAGNEASATLTVNIDKTAPTIVFSGGQSYTVDQTVAITCSTSDGLSGVASSDCSGVNGDAYAFAIGTTSLLARATDRADNSATATYSFTVRVTADSLCTLTRRFATKPLGSSLCAQLNAAASAGARGNTKAKANALDAYAREVNAQTGKAFTAEKAAILIRLAGQL